MILDNRSMIRAVALDLDGVIYEGDSAVEGAAETINRLRERGIDIYFVTNNSGKKRSSIETKLKNMGITSTVDNIMTSGYAASTLVSSLCSAKKDRILIIGSEELEDELTQFSGKIVHELPADILIVGFDTTFSYKQLSLGFNALHQGALFVACNRDRIFPVGGNQVLPGCGPIVAALEWASGREADYIVGKPNIMMLEMIARERGFKPHEILVVGDMLESDIAMAVRFGCPSVLISNDHAPPLPMGDIFPTFRIDSVEQLLMIMNEEQLMTNGILGEVYQ
jgi:HAD superfamily hydrolase (TIGR01450 family)